MNGPTIRSDIIDVYIFRRPASAPGKDHSVEFLQLRRSRAPMLGDWHPVMGHIEAGESAVETMIRELGEETGLRVPSDVVNAWALEQVHPFFMADRNEIHLSPRFTVEVASDWEPSLNTEHDAGRWINASSVATAFMWPGQLASIAEILAMLAQPLSRDALRLFARP